MKHQNQDRLNKPAGFTIIEMVVVVAVIVVIAGIAIPNMGNSDRDAKKRQEAERQAARREQIDLIKEAIREVEKERLTPEKAPPRKY